MPKQPLAEVFGFPINNRSEEARRYLTNRLCPFNNKVPNCTKDKAKDPLGVCSLFEGDETTIVCPVRFRQDWIITVDAAKFFFPQNAKWTSLLEIRLNDKHGRSAGNIDIVLVSYNDAGRIIDFGSVEVQGVYISGNLTNPFKHYMQDPDGRIDMDWTKERNYPRPDYLSSSRKRLAPQMIYKGGILKAWGKKTAVALNMGFFNTLPLLMKFAAMRGGVVVSEAKKHKDRSSPYLVEHRSHGASVPSGVALRPMTQEAANRHTRRIARTGGLTRIQ